MGRNISRRAGTNRYQIGLLIVACLLAVGLATTAFLSYRQARRSALAVLESRAIEIANAVAATNRLKAHPPSPERSKEILEAHGASSEVGLSIFRLDGEREAANPPSEPSSMPTHVIGELRLQGQTKRSRGGYLEYWRVLAPPRRGPGRRWRHKGFGRHFRPPFGPRRRRARVVRVRVAHSLSAPLLRSATTTLALSAATGGLLVVLGLVLFFVARRAAVNELRLREREALAELGELGAVLAHEVRTPLASIKGNAQLMCEQAGEDARCGSIVREAERLERLVNGLLDFARPAPLEFESVELLPLVKRAVDVVAPVAESSRVAVLVDPPEERLYAEAAADSLLQVLVNLLQNAIEATVAAKPRDALVTVSLRRARGELMLSITDRGVGITTRQDEAFRPFFTTKAQGTGLGLSVARQIVTQHRGSLELRAREMGGTVAEIRLPSRREA